MNITRSACAASALVGGLFAIAVGCSAQPAGAQDEDRSRVYGKGARLLGNTPAVDAALAHKLNSGIDYHGGPIMSGPVRMYYIWYGTWDAASKSILTNFGNGISDSPYFNIEASYFDASRTAASNSISYGGSATDNYSLGRALSDADIETIVSNILKKGNLPTDSNGVYVVLTSSDVMETSGFTTSYCAWHAWNNLNGSNVKYAFVGDASVIKPQACSAQTSVSPNGNPAVDAMVSFVAHEVNEAVNDPNFTGWTDSSGKESADKCSWAFGSVYKLPNGSMANVNVGGRHFLIQQNWVNAAGGYCALSYEIAPTPKAIPAATTGGSSGSLIGSANYGATAENLTTEGTLDWMHWGDGVPSRKAGVTAQLNGYTVVGGGGVLKYSGDFRPLNWTDGTPTQSITNDLAGLYVDAGRGFSIIAPADTTIRTLIVHAGGSNSGGTLTAHLSDNSASDFTNVISAVSGPYDANYTLTYQAGAAGQSLTATWKMTSGAGNVRLSAVALGGPAANVPTITATAGGSQSTSISTTFQTSLQATVRDANNLPITGAAVTFTAPGSGASGTFNGSATVGTDVNGVATAPALTANTFAGNYTVVASTASAAATASFTLTNEAGLPSIIAATGGTPQNAIINTAFDNLLSATVKDSGGNPVSGVPVTFTLPSSGASAAFSGTSTEVASTDGNGVATATVLTANGILGNYLVTAGAPGLLGAASFTLGNVAPGAGAGITLSQDASYNSGIVVSSVTVKFQAANTTGNWIAVAIYGGQGTAHQFIVTDSSGNTYLHALTQGNTVGDATMGIYYAENIRAGPNSVKVQPDHPGYLRVVILEYSGVATANSLDVTASGENTGLPNSGTVTTNADGDLLLGVEITGDANSVTAGLGYTIVDQVPALPGTKLTIEDQIQQTAGPASATISSANNWGWAMGLAAFRQAP